MGIRIMHKFITVFIMMLSMMQIIFLTKIESDIYKVKSKVNIIDKSLETSNIHLMDLKLDAILTSCQE